MRLYTLHSLLQLFASRLTSIRVSSSSIIIFYMENFVSEEKHLTSSKSWPRPSACRSIVSSLSRKLVIRLFPLPTHRYPLLKLSHTESYPRSHRSRVFPHLLRKKTSNLNSLSTTFSNHLLLQTFRYSLQVFAVGRYLMLLFFSWALATNMFVLEARSRKLDWPRLVVGADMDADIIPFGSFTAHP